MSTQPIADPGRLQPGQTVAGRYEIREHLGAGGFGWVYKAFDRELDETVALKFLKLAPQSVERARLEIKATRRVTHPNVIRIHDIGEAEDLRFISMEYLNARSLSQVLASRGKLPLNETMDLFGQICQGVSAAHKQGVIHRDLKPSNILLDKHRQVKVVDFGLASLMGSRGITLTGSLVGTPEYMSPEQVEGVPTDARSDVYALGIILFEMVTGSVPFSAETPMGTALARLRHPVPDPCSINPAIPGWLREIITGTLRVEPAERYQSVELVLSACRLGMEGVDNQVTQGLETAESAARGSGASPRGMAQVAPGSGKKDLRKILLIPAILVLGALGLAAYSFLPQGEGAGEERESLLADGTVKIAVFDFEGLRADEVSHMVASSLPEAVRARLSSREDTRLIALGGDPDTMGTGEAAALGVELIMTGTVARIGGGIKVLISITEVTTRERWLTLEENLQWNESWEDIESVADSILARYAQQLEQLQ